MGCIIGIGGGLLVMKERRLSQNEDGDANKR